MLICAMCDLDLCWMCGHGCSCDHRNEDRSEVWYGSRLPAARLGVPVPTTPADGGTVTTFPVRHHARPDDDAPDRTVSPRAA